MLKHSKEIMDISIDVSKFYSKIKENLIIDKNRENTKKCLKLGIYNSKMKKNTIF